MSGAHDRHRRSARRYGATAANPASTLLLRLATSAASSLVDSSNPQIADQLSAPRHRNKSDGVFETPKYSVSPAPSGLNSPNSVGIRSSQRLTRGIAILHGRDRVVPAPPGLIEDRQWLVGISTRLASNSETSPLSSTGFALGGSRGWWRRPAAATVPAGPGLLQTNPRPGSSHLGELPGSALSRLGDSNP